MPREKKTLLAINLVGGLLVLGSYAWGLLTHPGTASVLWGNLPAAVLPFYIASMLLAAAGYLLFTVYLLFVLDLSTVTINIQKGFSSFYILYTLILLPSALWMPLTYAMLARPSSLLWLAIRTVLLAVGMGGLGMLSALLSLRPRTRFMLAAFIGCIFFCIQVVLLDALVWPNYFVIP